MAPLLLPAASPGWWTERGVIDSANPANDYAAVNQGQVKFIAKQAMSEMDAHLPGGAGETVHNMVAAWGSPAATTDDFALINLGQLKHLAKPFYQRLKDVGYTSTFPWEGHAAQANDFAAANIGQVKALFSFDFTRLDPAHPGTLPTWWTHSYFPGQTVDPNADPDGDGLTNLEEYQQGTDPRDFYNGRVPQLTIVKGNGQTNPAGWTLQAPLVVKVTAGGNHALVNAPVTFSVVLGGGTLRAFSTDPPAATALARTDFQGKAQLFFTLPMTVVADIQITATAGGAPGVVFHESSLDPTSGGTGGANSSFFLPTDMRTTLNEDGSLEVSWSYRETPSTVVSFPVQVKMPDGSLSTRATATTEQTSIHLDAPN